MSKHSLRVALVAAVALTLAACGQQEPDPVDPGDPSATLFDPAAILEVAIEMAPADWDGLRLQSRDFFSSFEGECLADPISLPRPFTYFPGTVTVNGDRLENVGVRKKGFFGSLDEERPSLKVKFGEYGETGTYRGLTRLTLNNSKSDPSFVRQCLAYATFAAAGVPSPRCSFAHVTVNGDDLGVYVHIESVKKPFLRRHFEDDDGNLYEGAISDFRPEWVNTFEKKTNEMDPDRSDLDGVVAANEADDTSLLSALDAVIDTDELFTFWAAEVLIGHGDGYAGNTNNFYVYADPTTGRFTFMPWGVDSVFHPVGEAAAQPPAVLARGALARRLYLHAEGQARYVAEMRSLLDNVWDETALIAEVDRMEALITPVVAAAGGDVSGFTAAVEDTRTFINGRRGAILLELNSGPPVVEGDLPDDPCAFNAGDIDGTFATTFAADDGGNPFNVGSGTLVGTIDGVPLAPGQVAAGANFGDNVGAVGLALYALLPDGTIDVLWVSVPASEFVPGGSIYLGLGGSSVAMMYNFDTVTGDTTFLGILEGVLTLSEASTVPDAPVSGSLSGTVWQWGLIGG